MSGLDMWVIYAPGTDGQGQYVARCWHVTGQGPEPTGQTMHSPGLDMLRRAIQRMTGCDTRLDRQGDDEPHIVEVWI